MFEWCEEIRALNRLLALVYCSNVHPLAHTANKRSECPTSCVCLDSCSVYFHTSNGVCSESKHHC